MKYTFKGPGKYIVGNAGQVTARLKPGDVIEMEKAPSGVWVAKFELLDERSPSPTLEEWTAAGYAPEHYPPDGYEEVPSAGLTAFREQQQLAREQVELEVQRLASEQAELEYPTTVDEEAR